MSQPFYRGGSGAWRTESLFYERHRPSRDIPVFSLEQDIDGLINCRTTFVECGDLTGYRWAIKYLGSYAHLERLLELPWFSRAYASWQSEVVASMKSRALARLEELAEGTTNGAGAAAKYIVDEGWNAKPRGRPSAAEVAGNLKNETSKKSAEDLDMERIGLVVDNTKASA